MTEGPLVERRADLLLNAGPFELETVQAHVDALQASLGRNSDRTWEKWGAQYQTYGGWGNRDDFTTPPAEVAYVRDWLADHDAAVRTIWGL